MGEYFFQYKTNTFLFNTKLLKLFKIEGKRLIEMLNPEVLRQVRFNSIEVDRERAYSLVKRIEK